LVGAAIGEAGLPKRSHWTRAEPGWEEVADFAIDFAVRNARS